MAKEKKIKIYFIGSVQSPTMVRARKRLAAALRPLGVDSFVPVKGKPGQSYGSVKLDITKIRQCDICVVFGRVGRDSSWALGFAAGLGKPVVWVDDESNQDVLIEDWMTISRVWRIVPRKMGRRYGKLDFRLWLVLGFVARWDGDTES